jgi:putative flavoprotein involved in K+ transport
VADYFEAYAAKFELPIETGVKVRRLAADDGLFRVETEGRTYRAKNVVVATGTWQQPKTPEFAGELDPSIRQLHSHEYRNPSQLQPGRTLVVGAAHSGADIALEVANAGFDTVLAGPYRGEAPIDIESRLARVVLPLLWFAANHVLTERTPIGRKAQPHIRNGGGPLLRVKSAHLEAAGVEHVDDKVVGVEGGRPALADGRVLDVANVVWCTGFGKDMSWIDFLEPGEDGWPVQARGAVDGWPGLYFVGLPFLYAFSSMLVGGAGRDGDHVAKQIARSPAGRGAASVDAVPAHAA